MPGNDITQLKYTKSSDRINRQEGVKLSAHVLSCLKRYLAGEHMLCL
jgi:hypothetical protein